MKWPRVAKNDDGIRPAGKSDECLYCHSKVGEEHGRQCVVVTKIVSLKYMFEVNVEVPHFWNQDMILFHKTQSTWCASNALRDIKKMGSEKLGAMSEGCLCHCFTAEFVRTVSDEPHRKRRKKRR